MNSDARRPADVRALLEDTDHAVEELLRNIEREPVPERLLVLAKQLQAALVKRRARLCGTDERDVED